MNTPKADPGPASGRAPLTRRQQDVLEVLMKRVEAGQMSPTLEEIGAALGVSKVSAFEHVQALVTKGYIERRVAPGQTNSNRCYVLATARAVPLSRLERAFDGITGMLSVADVLMRLRLVASEYTEKRP